MFCLIGQTNMSQQQGEFHALHTFRGFTGCTIGISPQRSSSHECFQKAVQASFDEVLASKVKFLFSDSPERIFRAARRMFPSLIAVGEDPVHLPIRMEYCSGGKITKASLRLRQLHLKFRVASSSVTRFWQPDDNHLILSAWPDTLPHETRTPDEWGQFCLLPFPEDGGHSIYVDELAKICYTYEKYMSQKNSDGVTAKTVLKNGSSRWHYEGLQNSSRLFARLGVKGARLGTGTSRNEQIHRELKSWMSNIYMSHRDRYESSLRIFLLAKLLTHSSASYSPTLVQYTQSRLLSIIAGYMRDTHFFPHTPAPGVNVSITPPTHRRELNRPILPYNVPVAVARRNKRILENKIWIKRDIVGRERQTSTTDVFRRPRKDTRVRPYSYS